MQRPTAIVQLEPEEGQLTLPQGRVGAQLRTQYAAQLVIEQGVEMGRPSRIVLDIARTDGIAQPVRVSGECVEVMSGRLRL